MKHGLLFERFLSDARVDGRTEPPDIDVDIEHDRREEVLDYMYANYAREHAAITAVTQMLPRADRRAGRDARVRVSGGRDLRDLETRPRRRAGQLHRGIPVIAEARGVDIRRPRGGRAARRPSPAFDGLARLRSTHVGGFVLSAPPLGDYLPVEHTTMGRTIIQFDKDDLDAVGVPKFDFLGLGALSLVRRAFDMIEVRTGTRPEMYRLLPDDPATYDLIAHGETIGTFQIESRAQIASVLHTKPDRLYDIVVQVALIRPGPIQAKFVHPYTERRRGLEPVTYPHPDLEPILKRTQGIPIFQEQAMAIAMKLGGYSAAQADELRRTMGHIRKKEPARHGAGRSSKRAMLRARRGRDREPEVAEKICEDLKSFANYGFPESHAWSFALIAYATGYLKAHYPAEFFHRPAERAADGVLSRLDAGARCEAARRRRLAPCLASGGWECTVVAAPPCPHETMILRPDRVVSEERGWAIGPRPVQTSLGRPCVSISSESGPES